MQKPLPFIVLSVFIIIALVVGAISLSSTELMHLQRGNFSDHIIYAHGDVSIHVAIADTPTERQLGLGGRELMAAGQGMLFIFDESKRWRIWMKNMAFGIDILWLDKKGRVVDIREHVYPEMYNKNTLEVFEPREPARYILEVLVGFSGASGIRVGDVIELGYLNREK